MVTQIILVEYLLEVMHTTSPADHVKTIEFVTISHQQEMAISFGEIQSVSGNTWSTFASGSSPTRGVFGGGYYGSPGTDVANINYITIATLGNSEDFW